LFEQHTLPQQCVPLAQQVLPQTWLLAQHAPLTQLWPAGQQVLPQIWVLEQQVVFPTHVCPAGQH
jgi:hypothetical protein